MAFTLQWAILSAVKEQIVVFCTSVKVQLMMVLIMMCCVVGICSPMLSPRQLRFSLYSGAVITEDLM